MNRRVFGLILLSVLLLAACRKEPQGRLELRLEPMARTAAKLAVSNDTIAVWNDGDLINLNDVPTRVTRAADHAYAEATSLQAVNRACFPAGLVTAFSGSDDVTVHLPAAYHYCADSSGAQLVDMPLVARSTDENPLVFKHLTAALCIVLTNDRRQNDALVIDSIVVSSDAYRLSGDYALSLNAIESFAPQALGEGGTDNSVTLFFDRQRLEIPYGESRKVLIPVPPVGASNRFTVTVAARHQGARYNYTQTQSVGGALNRNVLAYAPMTLGSTTAYNLFAGYGTVSSPYQIGNACDWIAMTEAVTGGWNRSKSPGVNYNRACYKLMNPLDMSGISLNPIENYSSAVFDGNGKTVSNLTVTGSGDTLGLFRSIHDVKITNFTLANLTFLHSGTPDELFFGPIAGYAWASDTLDQCSVSYSQTFVSGATAYTYYGGLVGCCKNTTQSTKYVIFSGCSVANSSLQLTSSSNLYAGGLLGFSSGKNVITLQDCTWSGNMAFSSSGITLVGKLIGAFYGSSGGSLTTTNTTASGTVTVNGSECTKDVGNQ